MNKVAQNGAIELIALGLLAALILVLALPLFSEILVSDDAANSRYNRSVETK